MRKAASLSRLSSAGRHEGSFTRPPNDLNPSPKVERALSLAVVAAAWLLLIGSESRAGSINLPNTADNLQGNTVPFPHNWTFTFTEVVATGTNPSVIQVNALSRLSTTTTNSNAVLPFGFQLAGSIVSAATGQTSDLLLGFTVTSPGPITTVTLEGTGGATPNAGARIDETFTNGLTGSADGTLSLTGGGTVTFTLPTPTTDLEVSKNITANGGTVAGGIASYSDVQNTFNVGTGAVVPEPASWAMLGIGLSGLLAIRRFFKRASVA
jgi:PEP-CTERM motif